MEDKLSSEAMYEKHLDAVKENHQLLKLKRRRKKKKEEDEIVFHKGVFKVCFDFGEKDTLSTLS